MDRFFDFFKSAGSFIKDVAISALQAMPRALVSIGMNVENRIKQIFGKPPTEKFDPKTLGKIGTAIFGKEEIIPAEELIKKTGEKGEKLGELYFGEGGKILGKPLGMILAGTFLALDATPFGFGKSAISKKAIKEIAKLTSQDAIENVLKKEAPEIFGKSDDLLKFAASKLVNVSDPKNVVKTIKQTIKEFAQKQGRNIPVAPKIPDLPPPKYPSVGMGADFPEDFFRELAKKNISNKTEEVLSSFWKTRLKLGDITLQEFDNLFKKGIVTYEPQKFPELIKNLSKKLELAGVETVDDVIKAVKRGKIFNKALKKWEELAPNERVVLNYQLWKSVKNEKGLEELAQDLGFNLTKLATQLGRGTVAFKFLKKIDEELLKFSDNINPYVFYESVKSYLSNLGVNLSKQADEELLSFSKSLLQNIDLPERELFKNLKIGLESFIKKYFPDVPLTEQFNVMRYGWTLANPKSHARNGLSNLIQATITRPITLLSTFGVQKAKKFLRILDPTEELIEISDIKDYYKGLLTSLKLGMERFMETIRLGSYRTKYMEVLKEGNIEDLIRMSHLEVKGGKLYKLSTIPLKLMEAMDQLFGSLIFVGEKARLTKEFVKRGTQIDDLTQRLIDEKAMRIADYYLFRKNLGEDFKDVSQPLLVRALDGLGEFVLKVRNDLLENARKNKDFQSWSMYYAFSTFALFVRTPANIGKFLLDYSPLNIPEWFYRSITPTAKKFTSEQQAKILLGSLIAMLGAYKAFKGDITFLPPTDPKLKEEFYNAGLKPLSIKIYIPGIGERWFSIFNGGIPGLLLGFPAAVNWAKQELDVRENDYSFDKLILRSLTSSLNLVAKQTSLVNFDNFLNLVLGNPDYNLAQNIAFSTTQYIPFNGILRFFNYILDPIYRKAGKDLGEAFKREFSGYLKLWYKSLGKEDEEIEKLLPEPYLVENPETGKLEPAERDFLSDIIAPYYFGFESSKQLEEAYKKEIEDRIRSKKMIDSEITEEITLKRREVKAILNFIKNPEKTEEEKVNLLKQIYFENPDLYQSLVRKLKEEAKTLQLPEDIPDNLINKTNREKANFLINYIKEKKQQGLSEEEIGDRIIRAFKGGIINNSVLEEISLLLQSEK